MSKSVKAFRYRQQTEVQQINYLLGDVEKNLEEYRNVLELKEKQLSGAKKVLLSAKQMYDKTVAENKNLKAYIENLKRRFQSMQQQKQIQFLEKQRNYYQQKNIHQKNIKKVIFEEESESEPELEQEEEEEFENEEVEKEPEIKKAKVKKRESSGNNIFDYINKNTKRRKQQKYPR